MWSHDNWPRRVRLHGELGELFGEEWKLDVKDAAEAIRAIAAQRDGLYAYLRDSEQHGIGFAFLINDQYDGDVKYSLDADGLLHPLGNRTLEIVPMPVGAGDNGFVQILVGVVIIAAAVLATVFTAGAAGAGAGGLTGFLFGATGGSTGLLVGYTGIATAIGAALVLGGTTQLLAGTPQLGVAQEAADEAGGGSKARSTPSYAFSGAVNTVAQGARVPIGYGRMIVGSHVVSAGITNV